ncbi:uncharacterized protein [Miscanthus floridulus]|uniref:uncharacterized protein n=1 Tax=Miscanthus floridulus TaxID=154761 RepID=UPI00345A7F43
MPCEAEALELVEVEAPSIAKAIEGEAEASRTSEAEVVDAGAPRTTKAKVAEAGALGTIEAEVVEAGLGTVELAAQDAKTEAGQASIPPLVQDLPSSQESTREVEVHSISSSNTSWGKVVVDTKAASITEQPAPTSSEGSSALVRELKEELTRVADEWDAFQSRAEQAEISAKAVAGQLGAEQGAHLLMKGALAEALKLAEASRVKALAWKEKAKGLEKEVTRVAEASVAVQAVLDAKIREHNTLQSTTHTTYEALEVEGVESGSSLDSRLIALSV